MKNDGDFSGYQAFQGFAYFDDWGNDCPLESVSRVEPFQFTDITQILVIRSTFDPTKPRRQSCLWQFKAPKDYGFKIVITSIEILNSTFFKVENSQDTVITLSNVRTTYPHYTVDNYIKIYLSENLNNTYLPTDDENNFVPELTAYVTIIKNNLDHFSIHCPIKIDGNSTIWSYWNEEGYPNNARCTYSMKILPKTEIIAYQNEMSVESNVDVINFYDANTSHPGTHFDNKCFFTDGKNEKDILWEFISDGTVQSRGFQIQFDTKCMTFYLIFL
uniref:CUB domain-containing protein n=1 Tax=Panagrolaimus davidi TaxID=227884 RepID=A0A914P828_9BILA